MTTAISSCPSGSTPRAEPATEYRAGRLELADVRAFGRAAVDLPPGLTLLVGPNGAGKTTIVEAIVLGCLGVSPRTSREAEVVRTGAPAFHIALELDGPGGTGRREIGFAPGSRRRLRRDGVVAPSLASWRVRGAVLVFLPEELRAVKGPPAARRRSLDRLLEAAVPGYADDLGGYGEALAQRNALLRRVRAGVAGAEGLRAWEVPMARLGARVAAARRAAVAQLSAPFAAWLEALGGGAGAELVLQSSPASCAALPDDRLEEHLAGALLSRRDRDVAAAQTLAGPHRDDLLIAVAGHDLRRFGSQGEQRTAALALLLAHRDHLVARVARPILLLDDVLSELDPARRLRLLRAVSGAGQAIITTADPDAASLVGPDAQTIRVRDGRVHG